MASRSMLFGAQAIEQRRLLRVLSAAHVIRHHRHFAKSELRLALPGFLLQLLRCWCKGTLRGLTLLLRAFESEELGVLILVHFHSNLRGTASLHALYLGLLRYQPGLGLDFKLAELVQFELLALSSIQKRQGHFA